MVLHKQVLNLTDDDNCLLQKEQATLIGAVTGAVTPEDVSGDEDALASFSLDAVSFSSGGCFELFIVNWLLNDGMDLF